MERESYSLLVPHSSFIPNIFRRVHACRYTRAKSSKKMKRRCYSYRINETILFPRKFRTTMTLLISQWLPKGHDHGCPSNVGPNRTRTDQRPTTNDQRQVGQRYRTLSMSGHQARVRSWSKSSSGTTHVPTDTAKREETRENQASLYYLPSREPQSSLFTRFLWLTKNLFSFVQVFFRLQFQISNKNCYVFDIL